MGNEVNTATVEALTAEVRVLMVGSRQVTLSVARQLDLVEPNSITPFGRIAADRNPGVNQIEVIGADPDGVLVVSAMGFNWRKCVTATVWPGPTRVRHSPCGNCSLDDEEHDWVQYWGGGDGDLYLSWRDLPLIVLAGLR